MLRIIGIPPLENQLEPGTVKFDLVRRDPHLNRRIGKPDFNGYPKRLGLFLEEMATVRTDFGAEFT